MKTYSDAEYTKARENLPRPIADFLRSNALVSTYVGIAKKLKLNLRQADRMSAIVNATLLGLEPEHALEHNLHQELPELSNEKARELVADINDRIFKEATRRLRENIITQEEEWDEATFGPKDTYRPPVSDAEARKLVEAERKAKAEQPATADTKPADAAPTPPQSAPPQSPTSPAQEPGSITPPAPGIAKLQETVTTKPEEVVIAEPSPKPSNGSAQQTPTADPYRETIE